jgi:sodium-dependent dicarboxylate transporter 2/3/5
MTTMLLRLASGPLVFGVLLLLPYEDVPQQGRLALSVFGWMVAWWMTQPVPWGIASLLPLVAFPIFGVMNIGAAAGLYGQTIFFWIWGTILLGYAMDRHGVARRFALGFLALGWVGGSSRRVAFAFMLVTGLISMFISDAATVAIMIPVAISLVAFVRPLLPEGTSRSNFGAFLSLGALYGAVAGGTATIMGIPHNALALTILERLTGRSLGFFEWMQAGLPVFIVMLLISYAVLSWFLPLEFQRVPGGIEFLRRERAKLGPVSGAEKSTVFVFAMMVCLFVTPTLLGLILGSGHPVSAWSNRALNVNVVPPLVILLLFLTPIDWRNRQFVLSWRDAAANSPWDIMLLTTAAAGVVNVLVDFKFVELAGGIVLDLGLGPLSLPIVAAYTVAFATNVISGVAATAFFSGIFIPAAQEVGWNPASMAILIANGAVGVALPWAGASVGTAFATRQLDMKQMVAIGLVTTALFAASTTLVHLLVAPFL